MKVRTRPNLQELDGISSLFLRFALGLSFLAAVADRFGLWGPFGQPNVAWGDFSRFVDYTAKLNWFLPHAVIPTLAGIATLAEALLGFLLLTGWRLRIIAFVSGVLLLVFGLAMTFALGIKAPLNFSVFSAAGGGFLLAASSGRKRLRKDDNFEGEIMSDESKSPPSDQPPPSSKPLESDGSCADPVGNNNRHRRDYLFSCGLATERCYFAFINMPSGSRGPIGIKSQVSRLA